MSKSPMPLKPPSPTNVSNFPIKGWMSTTHPTKCVVSGRIGNIIGYDNFYFENECILCTRVFSVTAIASTIDNGASPPGSTELDDETGHNCKMSCELYKSFTLLVLGNHDSWANACAKSTFCNLILQDIDAIIYYYDTDNYVNGHLISLPGNLTNMAHILVRLTLLLIGTDAYTPHIIDSVWGEDANARLAFGGPRGDLSLVCRRLLTLSKVAINTVYIWMTNPNTPVFAPHSNGFKSLPPTVQQLLCHTHEKIVFLREPVPSGTTTTQLLTNNLCSYLVLDTLPFAKKAICWYLDLLLNHKKVNNMMGFDNGILITYGMRPPCKLQEYYQLDPERVSTHFMRGTADKVWGSDMHKIMYTMADDWTD
jgi:hypothetical protein